MIIEEVQGNKKNKNIPWIEKYRPSTLDEVISHEEIVATIKKFNEKNRLPNLLLYGPPGTGKTSTIIALAKQIYQNKYNQMVLELNASDERGINTVRETIKGFAESQSFTFTKDKNTSIKLVILDEADAMTAAAQFALRRIIEKYAKTTRFCFICNHISQIIPAIQSRCTRFKFKQISLDVASSRIKYICENENIPLDDQAIKSVFGLCSGDMRRVVNMLQSLSLSTSNSNLEVINSQYVYQFTGMAHPDLIKQIMEYLMNQSEIQKTYLKIKAILNEQGISLQLLLTELSTQLLGLNVLNDKQKCNVIERMAELEYRLSICCNDQVQLLSLIGIFHEVLL
ncbi:unnamed protein product [Paramecium octaurelia]|uniref:AAA+ ATPase domain-containing protein n=1 Tax=Paramecium octaurelia TaxID=43137 RepID=A0A8S1TN29_PAROT|nr:unnamed protein product [Paramecium octaurelia]